MILLRIRPALFVVLGIAVIVGCTDQRSPDGPAAKRDAAKDSAKSAADSHAHDHDCDHVEKGPHGGQVFELGGDYHAELVHDEASHRVQIFLLDAAVRDGVAIGEKQIVINAVVAGKPATFELAAAPLDGEGDGRSSRFESNDQALFHAVVEDHDSKSRLRVNIDGKQYVAEIAACEEHDHAGEHDH
jgi:hypothetical protein